MIPAATTSTGRSRRGRPPLVAVVAAVSLTIGLVVGAVGGGLAVGMMDSRSGSANIAGSAAVAGVSPTTDPTIAAAGDIACDPANRSFVDGRGSLTACRQGPVSDLLVDSGLTAVFPLGDLQYYCGSAKAFAESYDPSWGRLKNITHPVVGNHEYITKDSDEDSTSTNNPATGCDSSNKGAAGYFDYFGKAAGDATKGWYSLTVGTWHVVVLNSNCTYAGGCRIGSPQVDWLTADLKRHPAACTLALWHHPRFSSGEHGSDSDYVDFWKVLHAAGAEVVLNGHDHIYERFAPQTPSGALDGSTGLRQFVVGTGGANHTYIQKVAANSEVRDDQNFGVLRLTLHPDGYDWNFVAEPGSSFQDSGSGDCHPPVT